eukprot:CAMPEP_0119467808 /NCGR_PEP_ID=MMETSP1344-20130328/1828_1 /TAXON_ID=236787 /ORGANISM="Florenciella parvula, Strain CCMP2471" /LENGTH=225 /DNA_ID=CAMNT_0007500209 /DNA_START=346 /DNA_END=1022 /DNA_ORIENTATION=-
MEALRRVGRSARPKVGGSVVVVLSRCDSVGRSAADHVDRLHLDDQPGVAHLIRIELAPLARPCTHSARARLVGSVHHPERVFVVQLTDRCEHPSDDDLVFTGSSKSMSLEFGARFRTRSFCITGCAGAAVAAVIVALLSGDMAWRVLVLVGKDTDVVQAVACGAKQAPKSATRPTRNERAGRIVVSGGSKTASARLFFNLSPGAVCHSCDRLDDVCVLANEYEDP